MHFMHSRIPGNKTQVHTPLGNRVAENERDVIRIENEVIEEMQKRLGRPPTKAEMVSGPRPKDDRTFEEKVERKEWKPKRPAPDAMESLADSLVTKTEKPALAMGRMERMAQDAKMISQRNRNNSESEAQQKEKMRRLSPDLKKIDAAIAEENWRTENGSQRIVDLWEMAREQLVSGADATEMRRLRDEATRLTMERAKVETAHNHARLHALQQEMASIRDGSQLGNVGESDPVRYRAEQLMAEGSDSTSAWTTARAEATQE